MSESFTCQHEDKIFKKHDSSNRIYCLKRCVKCGCERGMCPKPKNIDEIPFLTFQEEQNFKDLKSSIQEEISRLNNEKFQQKRKEKKDLFFKEYNLYLSSELWKTKRTLVLKRDDFTCQACLTAKATQVHHKNYDHIYNEPLFDLESICDKCHENIHPHMKRN